jgi:perosamine synthetase
MIKFARPKVNSKVLFKIKRIINQGIFVHGKFTDEFEKKLSTFFKLKNNNLLTTSSCTASLHLYYLSIGLSKNDEVIMSAQTHVATAHAVEACGAKPIFVDCELLTGNIDIRKIEKKITKKTKCICVTHFLGKPTDMRKINKIAKKYNLKVVEDTALSIGSKIGNRFAGTFGDAGAFSFHPVKIITTGEGGAIILKNKKDFSLIKSMKSFGYDIASPNKRKIPGSYNVNFFGLNYRMSEIEAAIGIHELQEIQNKIKTRKSNYDYFLTKIEGLKNFKVLNISSDKTFTSSYYCLTLILNNKEKSYRDKVILRMKKIGIQLSIYYPHPVPLLNYYKKKYKYPNNNFYNASRISYNSLSFPVAPHIEFKDIDYMSKQIKNIIG